MGTDLCQKNRGGTGKQPTGGIVRICEPYDPGHEKNEGALRAGSLRHAGDGDRPGQRKAGRSPPKPRKGGVNQYPQVDKLERRKNPQMRIVDNGWRMPFFGKLEKHVGFRIRSKGTLCGKSVYQAKKFGDVDPKIATSQKAQKEFPLTRKKHTFTIILYILQFFCKISVNWTVDLIVNSVEQVNRNRNCRA